MRDALRHDQLDLKLDLVEYSIEGLMVTSNNEFYVKLLRKEDGITINYRANDLENKIKGGSGEFKKK